MIDPFKRWTDGSPVRQTLLEETIAKLALRDPAIHAALAAYPDFHDAVCAALVAHAEQHGRLVDALARAKSLQPVVIEVDWSPVPDVRTWSVVDLVERFGCDELINLMCIPCCDTSDWPQAKCADCTVRPSGFEEMEDE